MEDENYQLGKETAIRRIGKELFATILVVEDSVELVNFYRFLQKYAEENGILL